jgi:hypothetical protein
MCDDGTVNVGKSLTKSTNRGGVFCRLWFLSGDGYCWTGVGDVMQVMRIPEGAQLGI